MKQTLVGQMGQQRQCNKILLVVLVLLLSACARMDWEVAKMADTEAVYRYHCHFYGHDPLISDEACYRLACKRNSILGFLEYIDQHPDGIYIKEAKEKADPLAYKIAQDQNSIESYERYLKRFQDGKSASDATSMLEILYKKEEEMAAANALRSLDVDILEKFISKYPKSIHVDTVSQNLRSIKRVTDRVAEELSNNKKLSSISIGMRVDDLIKLLGQPDEPFEGALSITQAGFSGVISTGRYHIVKEGNIAGYLEVTCSTQEIASTIVNDKVIAISSGVGEVR